MGKEQFFQYYVCQLLDERNIKLPQDKVREIANNLTYNGWIDSLIYDLTLEEIQKCLSNLCQETKKCISL